MVLKVAIHTGSDEDFSGYSAWLKILGLSSEHPDLLLRARAPHIIPCKQVSLLLQTLLRLRKPAKMRAKFSSGTIRNGKKLLTRQMSYGSNQSESPLTRRGYTVLTSAPDIPHSVFVCSRFTVFTFTSVILFRWESSLAMLALRRESDGHTLRKNSFWPLLLSSRMVDEDA